MKQNSLKFIVGVLLLLTGLGFYFLQQPDKKTAELENIGSTYYAGAFKVQIKLAPAKPKIGNNTLRILIRNEQDQPVSDATLEASSEMPAMGSMPAMLEVVDIQESGNGFYQGHFSLPMNGSWPLAIQITSPALGKAELVFDMNTSRAGLKLSSATSSAMAPRQTSAEHVDEQTGMFVVDSYRRQLIGVTTSEVLCQKMTKTIHAAARVSYDESGLVDINLKYDAWIGTLNADYIGKQVQKGEPLFTVLKFPNY